MFEHSSPLTQGAGIVGQMFQDVGGNDEIKTRVGEVQFLRIHYLDAQFLLPAQFNCIFAYVDSLDMDKTRTPEFIQENPTGAANLQNLSIRPELCAGHQVMHCLPPCHKPPVRGFYVVVMSFELLLHVRVPISSTSFALRRQP